MEEERRLLLLENAKQFFRDRIIPSHLKSLKNASKLKNYNIHPFLLKYLANFLEGNDNPESIAKALIYPRILGTSITTIFGSNVQKMVSELFEGFGSAVPGIDIEFIDATDGQRKYCQLKSGPSTINKDDIATVIGHFQGIRNLARTNNLNIRLNDLIVGVLYGEPSDLSHHYNIIGRSYPVYVGADFWYRLTGQQTFYLELIDKIGEVAVDADSRVQLQNAIDLLTIDISKELD